MIPLKERSHATPRLNHSREHSTNNRSEPRPALAATADVQYMDDAWKDPAEPDVKGWVFGIRLVVEF